MDKSLAIGPEDSRNELMRFVRYKNDKEISTALLITLGGIDTDFDGYRCCR